MIPLRIRAHLNGPVCLPGGPISLDGLLAYAVALRGDLPPVLNTADVRPIEIPVQREPGGRFHLASFSEYEAEERENRWLNKRTDIVEAQALGDERFKRIGLSTGVNKSWRLPMEMIHLKGDVMTWWCIGDPAQVSDLLGCIGYISKKRGLGHGRVHRWDVEACEVWPGFPVVRNGQALRPLPIDWPGLSEDVEQAFRTLTYPYWQRHLEVLCAVPAWG